MENMYGSQHPASILSTTHQSSNKSHKPVQQITSESLINEFLTVFDNKVNPMEGEQFHIALVDEAKPFCVKPPGPYHTHTERAESRAPKPGRTRYNHTCILPY